MFEQFEISQDIMVFYKPADKQEMLQVFEKIKPQLDKIDEILYQNLSTPLRVYFTDSMLSVMFHTTTFGKKIAMFILLPFWYGKAKKYWNYSKGWLMKNNLLNSIVVKNSDGIKKSISMNKVVYKEEFEPKSIVEQQRRVFLHQYVQALLSKTRKPEWLEEGLSYMILEKYYGSSIIKEETLQMVQGLPESSVEDIIFSGIKGYWMIKYIDRNYPDLLDKLLKDIAEGTVESLEESLFSNLDGVDDKKTLFEKAVEQ